MSMDEVEKVMRTRQWEARTPVASTSGWTEALYEGHRAFAEEAAQVGLCDGELVFVNRQVSGDLPGYESFSFYEAIALIDSVKTKAGPIAGAETEQHLIDSIGLVRTLGLTITPAPNEKLEIKIRVVPKLSSVVPRGSGPAFISVSHQVAHGC